MKRLALVLLALLLFGAVKIPVERALDREYRAAFFRGANLNLGLREQIGQGAFLAALSGFRCVVADFIWIQVNTAWERTEWGRMLPLLNSVTSLQPRVVMFWEGASWHMAYNAASAAREDPKLGREAYRLKAEREYWNIGRDFLERGIRHNPDRHELYDRLGMLLRDKFKDYAAASEAYAQAAKCPDAMGYERRFAAYCLAECPGREVEAYAQLLKLYQEGPQERLPTLIRTLKALEKKLNIPEDQKVYISPKNGS